MLKNAKTEYSEEAEEIATYTAIESLARSVGDKETATLAREIRRQEERMAQFLARLIPQLTTAVVKEEIPRQFRNGAGASRPRPARRRPSARRATAARASARRSTPVRARGSSTRARAASGRSRRRGGASAT
jgi:rubrerythrin